MALNSHMFWEVVHGIGLGVLFCLSFAIVFYRLWQLRRMSLSTAELGKNIRWLNAGTWGMVITAWLMVLTGTYIVYPIYRVEPHHLEWYSLGIEWMEHVAWFAPIFATTLGYLVYRYGSQLVRETKIRQAAITFCVMALAAALIAGMCGEFMTEWTVVH